jgi:hypothetical protein
MLAHVERLTLAPSSVERTHLDELRALGFDDTAILQLTGIAAFFANVKTKADGLGGGRPKLPSVSATSTAAPAPPADG